MLDKKFFLKRLLILAHSSLEMTKVLPPNLSAVLKRISSFLQKLQTSPFYPAKMQLPPKNLVLTIFWVVGQKLSQSKPLILEVLAAGQKFSGKRSLITGVQAGGQQFLLKVFLIMLRAYTYRDPMGPALQYSKEGCK